MTRPVVCVLFLFLASVSCTESSLRQLNTVRPNVVNVNNIEFCANAITVDDADF